MQEKSKLGFFKSCALICYFFATYRSVQLYFYDLRTAIGPSMVPTIREGKVYSAGDLLLVDKITPRFRGYRKNDIVLAKSPMKLNSMLCKRVIAVGGEEVEVENNAYLVPPGYVWLEGDNKKQSFDSRDFGPVPIALLEGRAVMKIWAKPQFF
jgi:mitochondrial inner membrane protease subunit 1